MRMAKAGMKYRTSGTPYRESWEGMAGPHMQHTIKLFPSILRSRLKQPLTQTTMCSRNTRLATDVKKPMAAGIDLHLSCVSCLVTNAYLSQQAYSLTGNMTTLLLRKPAYLPKQLKNGFMRSYAFVTTRKPIIPSYYRFALKGGVNLYGGGID